APFLDLASLLVARRGAPPSAPEASAKPAPRTLPASESEGGKGYAVGLIRIDHLKVEGHHFTNFKSAALYRDRALQFREVEAQVEQGALKMNFAQVYFRKEGGVSLAMTPTLSDIDFEKTLKDFNPREERPFMSGKLLLMGGLNTEGRNFEEFKDHLRGNLAVFLENGTIYRFKTLARIFSLMNIRRLPNLELKGMPYRVISSKLSIRKGVVDLHDTVMIGRDVRMIAEGSVDLANNRLHLEMGVQVFKVADELLQEIPIAGYLLLGEDKMFIASYFDVEGSIDDPFVRFRPLKTIQEATLKILKRILTFPQKPKAFVE
ncbi:MAG TPA: AsmA-like C-terminal region-containing protein, partial [Candidatus Manganitrophaceae bacterium]|nr:AsmA-like C-terminal region-containing protein [Candidatus Manganitrophaceae bacterium]